MFYATQCTVTQTMALHGNKVPMELTAKAQQQEMGSEHAAYLDTAPIGFCQRFAPRSCNDSLPATPRREV
jgi:hypothetical protein